ncbi:MAG: Hpt domain-containing protein [Magnetococcus sp. MYC-9]
MTEKAATIVVCVDADLAEIVPAYLANRRQDGVRLAELLARQEFNAMRVLGHRMKGSGMGYGFKVISELGARLEKAAQAGSRSESAACIADLDDYLTRLEVSYTQETNLTNG